MDKIRDPWMGEPHPGLPEKLPRCNRGMCGKPEATWWNRSTQRLYCENCAKAINRANGIELCIPPEPSPPSTERGVYLWIDAPR